ncbi:MAG: type II toxin-antitoxin system HicA family toxin, partial [Actinobacteria bacterium]|nr:type II toxin-antitoxin system HicA family toxin [Actinomycetota bacterium]
IKRFRVLGWDGPRRGGDHAFMHNGTKKVKMPNPHKGAQVGVGLIAVILRQAGITTDEWNEAGRKKRKP